MLKIATLTFNPYGENTYVLFDQSRQCVVVDAGCLTEKECQTLDAFITKNDLIPILAVNTHGHIDHICGVEFVKRRWNIPFAIHRNEQPILDMVPCYAEAMGFPIKTVPTPDVDLAETKTITLGDSELQILQVPGHTPGHIAIYAPAEELLLVGDLLFKGSIGRTDLPGGDYPTIMRSLIEEIVPLPGTTHVFSGHGPQTTISHEIMFNPFIVEALQGEVNYCANEN